MYFIVPFNSVLFLFKDNNNADDEHLLVPKSFSTKVVIDNFVVLINPLAS